MSYSAMNDVADEEGFGVVYPQGTVDQQGNAFFP
jgi:poly(3-hydroxybutyrate) depolymerase